MRSNPVVVILGATLSASLVVGCASTTSVSTDFQPGTDFSIYKTFAFAAGTPVRNPFAEKRIQQAIAAQLTAKGLRQSEGTADLQVHTHARVRMEREVDVWDTGGWGYRRWGGPTRVDVRDVPVGTLVVDLVDRARRELVWRGVAQGTVDPRATPEKAEQRANEAMAKLFAGFPPGMG